MTDAVILMVDDGELTRAVLERSLKQAGYGVVEAADGVRGAVAGLRHGPALVVTDLEMPVMDGYQLTRLLKNDPATSTIPVVILTSHTEASSRFWGEDSGAAFSEGLISLADSRLYEAKAAGRRCIKP